MKHKLHMNTGFAKMVQHITITLLLISTIESKGSLEPDSLSETTDGLTFTDGVFYPTHSIQGMTYNSTTRSYEMPPQTLGSENSSTQLPDSAPLLAAYTDSSNKTEYINSLSALERASLFTVISPEDQSSFMSAFDPQVDWNNYYGMGNDWTNFYQLNRDNLTSFLRSLPSDYVVDAINAMTPWEGRVFPGAPSYYGVGRWGGIDKLNLSGLNLSGANLTGHNISGANLSNTGLTGTDLNGVSWMKGANLSYLNMEGWNPTQSTVGVNLAYSNLESWDTTGKNLSGMNFFGSNLSVEQLNASSQFGGFAESYPFTVLPNMSLQGLVTSGKSLAGINLAGTDISVAQLNSATDYRYANLSGRDLTGLDPAGKSFNGVNLVGSTITVEQLNAPMQTGLPSYMSDETILGANLSGKNLSGLIIAGRSLGNGSSATNLAGATGITGADLSLAKGLWGANLSGIDMTGFNPGSINIRSINFNGATNLTADMLAQASSLAPPTSYGFQYPMDLRGTGVMKAQLDQALVNLGKDPDSADYKTSLILFD